MDLEEYFQTTYREKLLLKQPQEEINLIMPGVPLAGKRREVADVEKALDNQKKEFEVKMQILMEQRNDLEKRKLDLKEYIIKFERFIRENHAKRERAENKAKIERERLKQEEKKIEKLESEISFYKEQKEAYLEKIEKNSIFFKCLEKIVNSTEEFGEIREIKSRYDALITTELDLIERDEKILKEIGNEKVKTVELVNKKNTEILFNNNKLAYLQTELDMLEGNLSKWENTWSRLQNTATEKDLSLGRTKIAIHNLFQLVGKYSRQSLDISADDTDQQLEKIQNFIHDLQFVVTEIKRSEVELF